MLQLRWRLEYANRPARVGRWNDLDSPKQCMAAYAPKDGLLEAVIEAKLPEGIIRRVGGCNGSEWEAFQTLAAAHMPGFFKGTIQPAHRFVGMILYTNDEKAFFLTTGKAWKEVRTDHNIQFEGWTQ